MLNIFYKSPPPGGGDDGSGDMATGDEGKFTLLGVRISIILLVLVPAIVAAIYFARQSPP